MSNRTNGKLVIGVLLLGMFLINTTFAGADPTYEDITVEPAEPERFSEVNFSVEITGDNISEVYIKVQECKDTDTGTGEVCSPTILNETMASSDGITWTGTATLEWDSTTIGHCWLVIKDNGTWYDYASNKLNKLTDFTVVAPDDGGDEDGDGSDSGGTPGFELVIVMISLLVAVSLYKRKRIK